MNPEVTSLQCMRVVTRDKTHYDMYVQRRLRSDCACAQSDLNLCCSTEKVLGPWISTERSAKTDQITRMSELIGVFAGRNILYGAFRHAESLSAQTYSFGNF